MAELETFGPAVVDRVRDPLIKLALGGAAMKDIYSSDGNYHGSDLLNAHTLACVRLGREPMAELVEEPVETNQATSKLGKLFLGLLNDSLLRTATAPNAFESGSLAGKDMCMETEFNMLLALGHVAGEFRTKQGRHTKLFYNDNDELLFIKKGKGVASVLACDDFALNNIYYPAGMLLQISEHSEATSVEVNPALRAYRTSAISKMIPLRLSAYALPLSERADAFAPKDTPRIPMPAEDYPETDNMTLPELLQHIPKKAPSNL